MTTLCCLCACQRTVPVRGNPHSRRTSAVLVGLQSALVLMTVRPGASWHMLSTLKLELFSSSRKNIHMSVYFSLPVCKCFLCFQACVQNEEWGEAHCLTEGSQGNLTLQATETNPENAKHSAIHILTVLPISAGWCDINSCGSEHEVFSEFFSRSLAILFILKKKKERAAHFNNHNPGLFLNNANTAPARNVAEVNKLTG